MSTRRASVREWPATERPREKLALLGASALSSAELMAIILRTGTSQADVLSIAQNLLIQFQGLRGLAAASVPELAREHGLGLAKATQIVATLELAQRLKLELGREAAVQIRSPEDVARIFQLEMGLLSQEVMRTVLLDTKNHIIGAPIVYKGSANTAVLRVGELFREAIKLSAVGMVLMHNHPSGDPTPSNEDINVTREIAEAGKLLDIELLDHLVIGHDGFVSMKAKGLGFLSH